MMTLFGAMQAVVCEAARVETPTLPCEAGEGARAAGGWGHRVDSAPVPSHSSNVRTNTQRTKEWGLLCWLSR